MLEVIIQGWQPQLFSAAIFKQADFKYLVSKVGIRECLPFQTLKPLIYPLKNKINILYYPLKPFHPSPYPL